MKKIVKKAGSLLLGVLLIASMLCMNVFAANTSDSSFSVSCFAVVSGNTGYRLKENTTPIYYWCKTSSAGASKADVSVHGKATSNALLDTNFTCLKSGSSVDHVVCKIGTKTSNKYMIHSTAYESENPYVCVWMTSGVVDTLSGVWSPDCAGTYTHATD